MTCKCFEPCSEVDLGESLAFSSWPLDREFREILYLYPERSEALSRTITSRENVNLALLKIDVYIDKLLFEVNEERAAYSVGDVTMYPCDLFIWFHSFDYSCSSQSSFLTLEGNCLCG